MIDKRVASMEAALAGLGSGARVMVNGFGGAGLVFSLDEMQSYKSGPQD